MANDITTTRSNVFQVTDIDKFKKNHGQSLYLRR